MSGYLSLNSTSRKKVEKQLETGFQSLTVREMRVKIVVNPCSSKRDGMEVKLSRRVLAARPQQ